MTISLDTSKRGEPSAHEAFAAPDDTALLTRLANELFQAMPSWINEKAGADQPRLDTPALRDRPEPAAIDPSGSEWGYVPEQAVDSSRFESSYLHTAAPSLPAIHYFLDEINQVFATQGREKDIRSSPVASAHPPFDVANIRKDFPILSEQIRGKPLIWLDNAATTQKPQAVIDRLAHFYAHENSNIHRAAHDLAARATDAYESARDTVARFLNAGSSDEIIFVRGTTEGINLVAQSWGRRHIGPGDEIVITWLEHHANIVPWQQLCAATGARLRVAPVDESGQILLDEYERLFNDRTRLAAFSHVSNALGTVTPAREMIEIAHRHGVKVLLDGAQAVSHLRTDVQSLDCDWYVFSGHKVFGPTGIGVVYGKREILENTPPWQGGGNLIRDVTFEKTVYHGAPGRFEAGTGNIADAVGLGAALEYVQRIGLENIH
ncbi:MAG: aminotransferase class V-fold PLP-dependent enzyme, partial [Methylococcaceae bacterium]